MNIVHISPSLYTGGGEKFAVDICNELAKDSKNIVTLVILEKINKNSIFLKSIHKNVELISMNKNGRLDIRTFINIFKCLKSLKPEIVHTHLRGLSYSFISLILMSIPTIHTMHSLAEKETGKYTQIIYKKLFVFFNILPIGISKTVSKSVEKLYGKSFNKYILNGVESLYTTEKLFNVSQEIDSYKKNNDTMVFLNIGRISKEKNHKLLVNLFKMDIMKNNNIILLIVGPRTTDSSLFNSFNQSIEKEDNIFYLGEKSNISDYIFKSTAFCISSLYEGLPLVVLENMSMGKPILATPAGGIPDVVGNRSLGLISNEFTEESFLKIVEEFILKPNFDIETIKNEFRKKYHISITAKKYSEFYKKMINNG